MLSKQKLLIATLSALFLAWLSTIPGAEIVGVAKASAQTFALQNGFLNGVASMAAAVAGILEVVALTAFRIVQFLMLPNFLLEMVTDVDSPGYQALNSIWRFSRDIMNIIFAFILIALGVITVVTADKSYVSNYFKKFIIAVILVNFSWYFPRLILDVANVLTATIYQIPSGMAGDARECKYVTGIDTNNTFKTETCKIMVDFRWDNNFCTTDPSVTVQNGWKTNLPICYRLIDYSADANTGYGIINGLVLNYGKLGQLTRVLNPSAAGTGGNVSPTSVSASQAFIYLIQIVIVLMTQIMIALPIIAMVIVFLIRIPIIWVTMAFMPFMFIGYLFGGVANIDTFDLIFKKFVKAAFLPTVVAIPFSIGFILLNALIDVPAPPSAQELVNKTGPILFQVDSIWGLIWLILPMLIIWFGFFSALQIDEIYAKAAGGIKSFGENIGKAALRAPLALPIIPVPKGSSLDPDGNGFASAINVSRQVGALSRTDDLAASLGKIAGGDDGGGGSGGGALKDFSQEFLNNPNNITNKKLEDIAQSLKGSNATKDGNTTRAELITELRTNVKVQEAFKKAGYNIDDPEKIADQLLSNGDFQAKLDEIEAEDAAGP